MLLKRKMPGQWVNKNKEEIRNNKNNRRQDAHAQAGFIEVMGNWTSQGKSENVFQSLESQEIWIIHQLLGKVREFKKSWVENQNLACNRLFFEASGDDRGALIIIQSSYHNCLK